MPRPAVGVGGGGGAQDDGAGALGLCGSPVCPAPWHDAPGHVSEVEAPPPQPLLTGHWMVTGVVESGPGADGLRARLTVLVGGGARGDASLAPPSSGGSFLLVFWKPVPFGHLLGVGGLWARGHCPGRSISRGACACTHFRALCGRWGTRCSLQFR